MAGKQTRADEGLALSAGGARFSYREKGAGTPLVLLHGGGSSGHRSSDC